MIDQKPAYMKVIPSFNNESLNFWVYVGFSAIEHSAVFKFNSLDISGPPMEEEEESSEELIQDVLRDSGEEDIALEVNEIDDKPQRDTPSPRDGHMSSPQRNSKETNLMQSASPGANKELEDMLKREISQI
jgi:hypothetical protein